MTTLIPYRPNRYRVLALVIGIVATIALGTRATVAGPPSGNLAPVRENTLPRQHQGAFPVTGMVRPPAEKHLTPMAADLTFAAIIRPVKEKKFTLAFVAGAPTPDKSPSFEIRPSVFKSSPSIISAHGSHETLQWVLLAGTTPAAKDVMGEVSRMAGGDDAGWHYSVEMVYVPVSTMTIRAALSMATVEEQNHSAKSPPFLERSRLGVTIGLDLRPKDGVMLAVDYARVMKDVPDYLIPLGGKTSHTIAGDGGDEKDRISISLNIQF